MGEDEKIEPTPKDEEQDDSEKINRESPNVTEEIINQRSDLHNMEVQKHPHHVTHIYRAVIFFKH